MDDLAFALTDAIGEPKTRQFLQALNGQCRTKRRLLFWQEQALDKVAEAHPEYAHLAYDDIVARLSICHVHGITLEHGQMAIETPPPYTSDSYYEKVDREFPYAYLVMYVKGG